MNASITLPLNSAKLRETCVSVGSTTITRQKSTIALMALRRLPSRSASAPKKYARFARKKKLKKSSAQLASTPTSLPYTCITADR